MDLPKSGDATSRFLAFVEGLTSVIGHADRAKPLRDYCIGLMMPGERKSVEPMAAITAPERTAAQHQSLLHFVGEGTWSDEKVLAKVREMVLPEIERHGPIEAWIIDDTGFPKKGRHSVGVGRQYCGELGKQDNCQIAVTLSIANHHASLPAAYRLYLPKEWATDGAVAPKEAAGIVRVGQAVDHVDTDQQHRLQRRPENRDIFQEKQGGRLSTNGQSPRGIRDETGRGAVSIGVVSKRSVPPQRSMPHHRRRQAKLRNGTG